MPLICPVPEISLNPLFLLFFMHLRNFGAQLGNCFEFTYRLGKLIVKGRELFNLNLLDGHCKGRLFARDLTVCSPPECNGYALFFP